MMRQLNLFPLDRKPVEGDVACNRGREGARLSRALPSCFCCKRGHRLQEVTLGETKECQDHDFEQAALWLLRESRDYRWHVIHAARHAVASARP